MIINRTKQSQFPKTFLCNE